MVMIDGDAVMVTVVMMVVIIIIITIFRYVSRARAS